MHLFKRSCTSKRTCQVLTDYAVTACRQSLPPSAMTRDRTAVTCEACVAEAPCWHCDGEGRKYHWDGLGKSEWRDCADCAGSGEASQDPFDPINRRAWDSGMEAYAARDDRVSESEAPEPIDPGACVDCGERAYTERDGAPLGAARCWDCGSREANED